MCHLRGSNLQSLTGWEKVHKKLIKDPCASGQIFGIGCLRNYGTAVYHLNLLDQLRLGQPLKQQTGRYQQQKAQSHADNGRGGFAGVQHGYQMEKRHMHKV